MTQKITVNQNKGSRGAGILVVRADGTGSVTANSTGALGEERGAVGDENINAMYIAEIAWSCSAATDKWVVSRGTLTTLVLNPAISANSGEYAADLTSEANGVILTDVGTSNNVYITNDYSGTYSIGDDIEIFFANGVSTGVTSNVAGISTSADVAWTSYGQNGHIKFQETNLRLETPLQATANVDFTLTGIGNIMIKLHKQSGEE